MPRLKLDIFSTESSASEKGTKEEIKPLQKEKKEPVAPIRELATTMPEKEESPRFVPVGFYERHLCLLDEAVIGLRRKGYWKASKSSIIRLLIERNAGNLEEIWLVGVHADAHERPVGDSAQYEQA